MPGDARAEAGGALPAGDPAERRADGRRRAGPRGGARRTGAERGARRRRTMSLRVDVAGGRAHRAALAGGEPPAHRAHHAGRGHRRRHAAGDRRHHPGAQHVLREAARAASAPPRSTSRKCPWVDDRRLVEVPQPQAASPWRRCEATAPAVAATSTAVVPDGERATDVDLTAPDQSVSAVDIDGTTAEYLKISRLRGDRGPLPHRRGRRDRAAGGGASARTSPSSSSPTSSPLGQRCGVDDRPFQRRRRAGARRGRSSARTRT